MEFDSEEDRELHHAKRHRSKRSAAGHQLSPNDEKPASNAPESSHAAVHCIASEVQDSSELGHWTEKDKQWLLELVAKHKPHGAKGWEVRQIS